MESLLCRRIAQNIGSGVFPFGQSRDIYGRLIALRMGFPCGGGLGHLYHSPASRKRRSEGNPVPGGTAEQPCSWGYRYGNLALQVGGVSGETINYDYGFCVTRSVE
jgi:hypothetical protein